MNEILTICFKAIILFIWLTSPVLLGGLLRLILASKYRSLLALLGALLIIWANTFAYIGIESFEFFRYPYDYIHECIWWLIKFALHLGIKITIIFPFTFLGVIAVDKIGWFRQRTGQARFSVLLMRVSVLMLLLAIPSIMTMIATCGLDLATVNGSKAFSNIYVSRILAVRAFVIVCGVILILTFMFAGIMNIKRLVCGKPAITNNSRK